MLASNAATQSYGITLQQGAEGTGPPPHSHDWDEAFYVLKGEIHFLTGRNGSDPVLMRTDLHGFKEDVRKITWESEYPNAWLIEREETSTHEG